MTGLGSVPNSPSAHQTPEGVIWRCGTFTVMTGRSFYVASAVPSRSIAARAAPREAILFARLTRQRAEGSASGA
jgi:hypothetical protein